jgi:hypothetical protein
MENVTVATKKWYMSKTLWGNAAMAAILVLQMVSGHMVLDADAQAIIVAIINILLRFTTKTAIV